VPTHAMGRGARPHLTGKALRELFVASGLSPLRAEVSRLRLLHRDGDLVVTPRRQRVVRLAVATIVVGNHRRRACARLAATCQGTDGAAGLDSFSTELTPCESQVRRAGPPSQNLGALLTRRHALGSPRLNHDGLGRGAPAHAGLHARWKGTCEDAPFRRSEHSLTWLRVRAAVPAHESGASVRLPSCSSAEKSAGGARLSSTHSLLRAPSDSSTDRLVHGGLR
jgi:hypothetical protein